MKQFAINVALLVMSCLFFLSEIQAQGTSRGISVNIRESEAKDARVLESVELYAESYALVIGNDNYTAGWPKLSNAVKDAELIADVLESKGFDVELHRNLDANALSQVFKRFFILKGDNPEARLFIWYAGHGATVDGEGYLVPTDAPLPNAGAGFKFASVALRDFGTFMRQAVAKHAYAVFDSCFAGTVFSSQRAMPPAAITRATTRPVRQFLTSGDADQAVSDDGTFRELFIRAITGEERSDANGDGYVTASELGMFLGDRITNLTESLQTPRYGKLRDKNFDLGDFVFTLPGGAVASATQVADGGAEITFWNSIKNSDNSGEYNAYLKQYPDGVFAELAMVKKKTLDKKSQSARAVSRPREKFKVTFVDSDMEASRVANIRQAPFRSAPRVGRLDKGDRVWVTGQTQTRGGSWYKVARDGVELGFIYAPLLASVGRVDASLMIDAPPAEAARVVEDVLAAPELPVETATPSSWVDNRLLQVLEDVLAEQGNSKQRPAEGQQPATGASTTTAQILTEGRISQQEDLTLPQVTGASVEAAMGAKTIEKTIRQGTSQPITETAAMQLAMITQQPEADHREAISEQLKRYLVSATGGNSKAQLYVAYMYETGEQAEVDKEAAVAWYKRAAAQGELQAMLSLAVMYEEGDGVDTDLSESAGWYRKAAVTGDSDAQQTIGYRYENGKGVVKDAAEAARWYEKAAEQGRIAAQNNLGRLYQLGIGVEKNLDKATFWYGQAASQGSETARKNLDKLTPVGSTESPEQN